MICIFLIFITPLFFFPISLLFAFPLFWCDGIYFFTIAKNRTKIEHEREVNEYIDWISKNDHLKLEMDRFNISTQKRIIEYLQ